jgi:putative transposase
MDMEPSRFTEEQIIGILREQEAGAKTADVCRSATFYKWKAKFGGLEVSDAKRLRARENENTKLKKLLAEAMLDNAMLKEIAAKKWCRPPPGERPSHSFGSTTLNSRQQVTASEMTQVWKAARPLGLEVVNSEIRRGKDISG